MKKRILLLSLACLVCCLTGYLWANQESPHHFELYPALRPTITDRVDRVMVLDQNNDGVLTKQDLPGAYESILERADQDGDGMATRGEIAEMILAVGN